MIQASRVTSLDGLRGWAALSVMFCHMMQLSPPVWTAFTRTSKDDHSAGALAEILTYSPLHLFWAGGEAVALFFVLSGYVLSAAFWRDGDPPYRSFLIRRIFRIYPAFLIVCVLAWFAAIAISQHSERGISVWFIQYWKRPVGFVDLLPAVFMGFGPYLNLIPPTWSLVCEMRISVIFPLIIWLMRRTGIWLLPISVLVSAAFKIAEQHFHSPPAADLWLTTGAQLWLFVLGAELNRRMPWLLDRIRFLGPASVWMMFILGLMMLIARWIMPFPLPICYLLSGLGAGVLIVVAVKSGPISQMLDCAASQTLGRWSYSLYLLHFPVLSVLVYGLTPQFPLWLALVFTPPVTLLLAAVSQAFVERPFIGLGRALAGRSHPVAST